MATEVEGQPSKQTWGLENNKKIVVNIPTKLSLQSLLWLICAQNTFTNLLHCPKPSSARAIKGSMNISIDLKRLFWDWFSSLKTSFQP
jgi:hypothetical protein